MERELNQAVGAGMVWLAWGMHAERNGRQTGLGSSLLTEDAKCQ